MGINVQNTKEMRITREPSQVQIMEDQQQLENVDISNIWVAW
jgi:hypothetical protein